VLEAWYPGIRGGEAIANILFGDVNPSGKLPVTFPMSANDLPHPVMAAPSVMRGPLDGVFETLPPFDIPYSEGLKVGYKWFDEEHKNPLFAFGHGLSYTDFTYSDLNLERNRATLLVKNAGHRAGGEIVQLYARLPEGAGEPPKRLVSWQRVQLAPGESKPITLEINPWFLSIYDPVKDAWKQPDGEYELFVGGSSDKPRLSVRITIPLAR
jgi:beta-glucosidase